MILEVFQLRKTLSTTRFRLVWQRFWCRPSALFQIVILALHGYRCTPFLFFSDCMSLATCHIRTALRIQVTCTVLFRTVLPTLNHIQAHVSYWSLKCRNGFVNNFQITWFLEQLTGESAQILERRLKTRTYACELIPFDGQFSSFEKQGTSLIMEIVFETPPYMHSIIRFCRSACTAPSHVSRIFKAWPNFLSRSLFSSFIAESPYLLYNLPLSLLDRMMPSGKTEISCEGFLPYFITYAQLPHTVTQSLVFERYNKSSLHFRSHEYPQVFWQFTKLDLVQKVVSYEIKHQKIFWNAKYFLSFYWNHR